MVNLNDPNIPILGQAQAIADGPNAPGLTANCEIHDSEILEIEKVIRALNERTHNGTKKVDYDAFDREIKERFQNIGFKASVAWWHTNIDGVKMPEITITDRLSAKEFDYDRQVHEVTNDLLDLGEGGVIKSNPADFQKPTGHGHGH